MFHQIGEEERKKLLACMDGRETVWEKGQILLGEEEPADHLGIVLEGSLQVVEEDIWGNRGILEQVGEGELYGAAFACAGIQKSPVSVVAAKKSRVLRIQMEKLMQVCPNSCPAHQQMIRNLVYLLARKNVALNEKIKHISRRTTREKLLAYLADQAKKAGKKDFSIPFDRQELADYLRQQVSAELPDAAINGEGDIPHVVNLSMPGCKSEVMLHVLEGDEVYISSGSACSKGKQSGVLKALGLPKTRTDSALRVSFAPFNTKEDVDAFIAAVKKGAKMFRR